ncbi:MAG: gamma-glutamyl-gamma-aminobutyrate hydrolase family protein [Flavobacteriales bacterium]|nr:gamma-glutamyl-gamma-aminobutyrate hydrolase family protein [Flavobacteriales bacterium]
MKRIPLIAIGPHFIRTATKKQAVGAYKRYIDMIHKSGGHGVIITPGPYQANHLAKTFDGLLLQGGGDIHPRYFGQRMPKNAKLALSPNERTNFDLGIIRAFLRLNKPFLGICLGAQTLNICLGGDIIQDIPTQCEDALDHTRGQHLTHIHPKSKLAKIVKVAKLKTNSLHHQSIGSLGKNLMICAQAKDGIIEAIESKNHKFALGIQWHPELHGKIKASQRIFKAFVAAC